MKNWCVERRPPESGEMRICETLPIDNWEITEEWKLSWKKKKPGRTAWEEIYCAIAWRRRRWQWRRWDSKRTTMTRESSIVERWSGKFYVLLVMKALHHAIQITIHNVDFQYCWFISGKIKIMSNFLHHYFRHLPLAFLSLEICFNFFSYSVSSCASCRAMSGTYEKRIWTFLEGREREELLVVCREDAMEGNQVWINHWTLKFHFLASSASRDSASMGDDYTMSEVCVYIGAEISRVCAVSKG